MFSATRYRYSLLSFLILISCIGLAFLAFFPSRHSLTPYMGIFIFYLFVIILGLAGGIGLVVSRATGHASIKSSFRYNFFGTLNLCTGISGLVLATIGDGDGIILILIILNLLLGILIYKDIYSNSREEMKHH